MEIGSWVAVVSAMASVIAIVVSLKTATDQRKLARQLAEEEHRLLFEQVRVARDNDIIQWTSACLDVLAETEAHLAIFADAKQEPFALATADQKKLLGLAHRLSALIDQGRLYFPNQAPHTVGTDKPSTYQGHRQLILTTLVRAFDATTAWLSHPSWEGLTDLRQRLTDLRRLFVSEAQLAIDPRRYIALKEMNDVKAKLGRRLQELDKMEEI